MAEFQVLHASAAETATGAGPGVPTPNGFKVAVHVSVTAVSGTSPNYTFSVQWSNDGATWYDADPAESFTAITAAKNLAKAFDPKGRVMRLAWAVTGTTPSATFSANVVGVSDD